MLGGQHNGVDGHRLAVLVVEGDLALGVRPQPGEHALAAHLGLAVHQPVRVSDRCRHQHIGFIGGVAEHQALVTGALIFRLGPVHALVDVR